MRDSHRYRTFSVSANRKQEHLIKQNTNVQNKRQKVEINQIIFFFRRPGTIYRCLSRSIATDYRSTPSTYLRLYCFFLLGGDLKKMFH